MASNSEDMESDVESLGSIFKEGLDLYHNLGKIDEPTNSLSVQINIKKAITLFEDATRLVSMAGLFSRNESVEEIPTTYLQYLILPALLGKLCLKLTSGDRKDITEVADIYFKDYLQRCNDYNLSDYNFTSKSTENGESSKRSGTGFDQLKDMINTRATKIQRFKEQKELAEKLKIIKESMDNENVDDEVKRSFYLMTIKLFIYESIDELSSIETEKQILEHMARYGRDESAKPKRQPVKPLKPVIITKDAVQKQVFGLGYPSVPVMSVEEFYDKRVRDGIFPGPTKNTGVTSLQQGALEGREVNDDSEEQDVEEKLENDDPELLEKLRNRDEFKDEHRRGWGNRMNRS